MARVYSTGGILLCAAVLGCMDSPEPPIAFDTAHALHVPSSDSAPAAQLVRTLWVELGAPVDTLSYVHGDALRLVLAEGAFTGPLTIRHGKCSGRHSVPIMPLLRVGHLAWLTFAQERGFSRILIVTAEQRVTTNRPRWLGGVSSCGYGRGVTQYTPALWADYARGDVLYRSR
jgi:hypothetical protein